MTNLYPDLIEQHYAGKFERPEHSPYTESEFAFGDKVWHVAYDDWYRVYFENGGNNLRANIATQKLLVTAAGQLYAHMDKGYQPCAISGGSIASLAAVEAGYWSTDVLDKYIASQRHVYKHIKPNSERSLVRSKIMAQHFPDILFVPPAMKESIYRAHSAQVSNKLRDLPFREGDHMAGWNDLITGIKTYTLDDRNLDRPSVKRVRQEIERAKGSDMNLEPLFLRTTDWTNSRNSIYEMARANYIRFGLHPLRPEADLDMWLYDDATDSMHEATHLDLFKAAAEHVVRWAPQGIWCETAVRTAARFIHLHRMRIDPAYNAAQENPLDLDKLPDIIAKPSHQEVLEFNVLIAKFEPFLLKYCGHMIKPDGLPEVYVTAAQQAKFQKPCKQAMEWQRKNIPTDEVLEIFPLTHPRDYRQQDARPKPETIVTNTQKPQHDFSRLPFDRSQNDTELFKDNPFEDLDEMTQKVLREIMGATNARLLPQNAQDVHIVPVDYKRGEVGAEKLKELKISNPNALPGAMGGAFTEAVREHNHKEAQFLINDFQYDDTGNPQLVIGTTHIKDVRTYYKKLRHLFRGPGESSISSDGELAFMLEQLRDHGTHLVLRNGWQYSDYETRMMLMATKMQLGLVQRAGGNDLEMSVINPDRAQLSFYDRFKALYEALREGVHDPEFSKTINDARSRKSAGYGARYRARTLMQMTEILACLNDAQHNAGRITAHLPHSASEFYKDYHRITNEGLFQRAKDLLLTHYVHEMEEDDFDDIRQEEYREEWQVQQGFFDWETSPEPTDDRATYVPFPV